MTRTYKRWLLTALIALAPVFTACERAEDINSLENVDVQYNGSPTSSAANNREARLIARTTTSATSGTVYAWVSPGMPATLKAGDYTLFVPKGAIHKMTLFRMEVMSGNYIGVKLNAYTVDGGPVTQFKTLLRLTLPYSEAAAEDVADPSKLLIANVSEDGLNSILELVNAAPNQTARTITGSISHFSDYILGTL